MSVSHCDEPVLQDMRSVLSDLPAGVFHMTRDADNNAVLCYANAAFKSLHGLHGDVVGLNDICAPLDFDAAVHVEAHIQQAVCMGADFDVTYCVMGREQPVWVRTRASARHSANGAVFWSGISVDVTDQKAAEAAVYASEAKYRTMFDKAITGKWVHRNFKPLAANGALAHMLGFSSGDELVHEPDVRVFMSDEMRQSTEEAWIGLLSHNAKFYRRRLQLRSRMGRDVWVDVVSSLIDWDGQPAMHDNLINVTAEVEKEHELQAARADAELALMSQSQFLAAVSHEVRTPMNGIIAMADVLSLSSLNAEQQDCLALLTASAQHMMRLVDNILDFDRLDAGRMALDPAPLDMLGLLEERLAAWRPRARAKGLRLFSEWSMQSDTHIFADHAALARVLDHLLGNAVKFSDSGHIDLRAYSIHPNAHETRMRIEVADMGPGLAQDNDDDRVFEAFHHSGSGTHRTYSGLGLGLAICRKIMSLMGGRIGVISHPNQGSTFWIECTFKRVNAATEWDQSRVA